MMVGTSNFNNFSRKYFSSASFKIQIISALLLFLATLISATTPALALTEVEVSPVNTPEGTVVLIVDGLSAPFIYPELTPHALDGTRLDKAKLENLPKISEESARVLKFRVPQTFTEGGHSVLVTGKTDADSELVSFKDSTIFDVLHKEGYLCIAIMEKGDSGTMSAEQDVILKDENNSIKNIHIVLEKNEQAPNVPEVPAELVQVLKKAADKAPEYVDSKETRERYNGYNRWGIETACAVVKYMSKNMPEQKYLLILNVGAIDDSGHYRDNYGYIDCIESLDSEIPQLYELCKKNDLAFFLTADHGMGFSKADSKGGHQSDKFSGIDETQLVPLIIHTQNIKTGVIQEEHGQEDFVPTLLGILDIPDRPRFSEGEQILLTGHVNLKVKLPEAGSVELRKTEKGIEDSEEKKETTEENEDNNDNNRNVKETDELISSLKNDNEFLFLGLEPEKPYLVKVALNSGNNLENEEKEVFLKTDSVVEFKKKGQISIESKEDNSSITGILGGNPGTSGISGSNSSHLLAYLLIGLINVIGIIIIAKILKKG
jgi:2,3-bisphosphoglycerate-independent phosphoglycerate mutase